MNGDDLEAARIATQLEVRLDDGRTVLITYSGRAISRRASACASTSTSAPLSLSSVFPRLTRRSIMKRVLLAAMLAAATFAAAAHAGTTGSGCRSAGMASRT